MKQKQYDIFISYRRSSYDTANLVATRLRAEGYSVFFDMETLRTGKFNEQLFGAIEQCQDFVVVLPPNALDRCVNEDDWVRLEVCHAMKHNKNIIPVMLNGFQWPNPMPVGMEELCNYQAITASSREYFDLALERMQQRYLLSKPHLPVLKVAKVAAVVISALLLLSMVLWGVFRVLSRDVCVQYATSLTKDASAVHVIAEENQRLSNVWNDYATRIRYGKNTPELQAEMLAIFDSADKNVSRAWQVDSLPLQINNYHRFLLSLHGINAEEISISPVFATLYYQEFVDNLQALSQVVQAPDEYGLRWRSTLLEVEKHSLNSYYIAILSELSHFPEYSRKVYKQMSPQWRCWKSLGYPLDEKDEYYMELTYNEDELASDLIAAFESDLEKQDAKLDDLERQLNDLENKADTLELLNELVLQQTQQQELAIREEKLKAKLVSLNASKAALNDLENMADSLELWNELVLQQKYIEAYNSLIAKCTIDSTDEQWYQWGKICRLGSFMSLVIENRKQLKEQSISSSSAITPEKIYKDISTQLAAYQGYHPESADYVQSAELFFREVSQEKRKYAGVLVFAFRDGVEHPILQVGDILISYDNQPITTYNDLRQAYQANKIVDVKFLRIQNGQFVVMKGQLENTDDIGFIELVELVE